MDYMAGVHAACCSYQFHSVSATEEEEATDEDGIRQIDEVAEQPAHTDTTSEFSECPAITANVKGLHQAADLSDGDGDLIDRQIEYDCSELCADHRQILEDQNMNDSAASTDDGCDDDARDHLPSLISDSRLRAFADQIFQTAQDQPPKFCKHDMLASEKDSLSRDVHRTRRLVPPEQRLLKGQKSSRSRLQKDIQREPQLDYPGKRQARSAPNTANTWICNQKSTSPFETAQKRGSKDRYGKSRKGNHELLIMDLLDLGRS